MPSVSGAGSSPGCHWLSEQRRCILSSSRGVLKEVGDDGGVTIVVLAREDRVSCGVGGGHIYPSGAVSATGAAFFLKGGE